jgi:hypothetical protein
MPYNDSKRKREWERINRLKRLARRRELRHRKAAQQIPIPVSTDPDARPEFPWGLLAGGGLLALYNPPVALGAGALILVIAAFQKRGWQWWAVGTGILAVAILFLSRNQSADATDAVSAKT